MCAVKTNNFAAIEGYFSGDQEIIHHINRFRNCYLECKVCKDLMVNMDLCKVASDGRPFDFEPCDGMPKTA